MDKPVRAANKPFPFEVKEGETYYWCSCGKSANQPFCDSSHDGSKFFPFKYEATETKTVYFCGCKQTHNHPFCDRSHENDPD
ncbi:MAG: CDGSH iron-sulfur domain-containing protein [Methylomonas sp.]|jgi:CDGSH-type Zn-finger protein